MTQTQTNNIDNFVNDFITEFCPFGWMDCKAAVQSAIGAGYCAKWAAEQVQNFCDQTGTKIEDCDPNYCVMDAILQEARNEISDKAKFDFCNDCSTGEIYTAGNFMCTSYDYNQEAKDELIQAIAAQNIDIADLSEATQYFLDQCEISQNDINDIIKELNDE